MTYEARWGESARLLADADEAEEFVDDTARAYGPDGRRGIVIGFGPPHADPQLEIAINIDEGRAALYWLPEPTSHAIETCLPPHPRPIRTWSYRDEGQREIPGNLARVTPGAALAAIREYMNTGQQPTNVTWESVNH